MVQDTDSLENMSGNLDLAREVRWVSENLLRLGFELHGLLSAAVLHSSLDTNSLVAIIDDLVNVGVEHVCSSIDSGQTGKSLRKLAETVEWVDVGGLSVAGDGVSVEADTLDGFWGITLLVEVGIGLVESHGVADEVSSSCLEAKLVVDIFHCACVDVETFVY